MNDVVNYSEDFDGLEGLFQDPDLIECADNLKEIIIARANAGRKGGISYDDLEKMKAEFDVFLADKTKDRSDREEFMAALYRVMTIRALQGFIDFFSLKDFQGFVNVCQNNVDPDKPCIQGDIAESDRIIGEMGKCSKFLMEMGFDRPPSGSAIEKSPFSWPFNKADVNKSFWRENLEIGENFRHAFFHLFDTHTFYMMASGIYKGNEGYGERLDQSFLRECNLIPVVIRIMRTYKSIMEGKVEARDVDVAELLSPHRLLLEKRYKENYETDSSLPVNFENVQDGLTIRNADIDALTVAIWEIVKNSFREDKVTKEQLQAFNDSGEAYLTVSAGETTLNGKEVVVFEIQDRGTRIDIAKIVEKMGSLLFGYEARDITLGQILDYLSTRHLSIPLKGNDGEEKAMYTGIGLHSARKLVQAHKGEIFSANLKDGVGFLVVIPKDGMEADFNLSDLKISGLQCGKMSQDIAATQQELQNEIQNRIRMVLGMIALVAFKKKPRKSQINLMRG